MSWRLAKSLVQMRAELDTNYPGRDRTSDGSIGDAEHASRDSDHNPFIKDHNGQPIVRAIDVDRDIAPGFISRDLAEWLRQRRDDRAMMVISDRRIFTSYPKPHREAYEWGPYDGPNAHKEHMHISVPQAESLFDNQKPWGLFAASTVPNPPPAPPVVPIIVPTVPTIIIGRATLRLGSAGPDVAYLQRMLGPPSNFTGKWDDSDFGPKTRDRVKAFQIRAGIDPSGVVDGPVWAALEA